MGSTSHIERTAAQPRDKTLHEVILAKVVVVNEQIKTFRLSLPLGSPSLKFLPGQWLDVYIPQIPQPGGFTITSIPADAEPDAPQPQMDWNKESGGFVELAVQNSASNEVAQWFWQPESNILGLKLKVRVGGSFVWPPPNVSIESVRRVLLVAGGVGINPLISIMEHISQIRPIPFEVRFIYSVRDPRGPRDLNRILYLNRLMAIFKRNPTIGKLSIYLTPCPDQARGALDINDSWKEKMEYVGRRVQKDEVIKELGPVDERQHTICYVCGVPTMTDELIEAVRDAEGMNQAHVFFERWW